MSTTQREQERDPLPDRHDADKHDADKKHGDKEHDHTEVDVTIAAPNNASHEFTVDLRERVDKVARHAVAHFVRKQQMEQMECGLSLISHGAARPLDDTARLAESGVHKHSRLVLVPKQPKTDG